MKKRGRKSKYSEEIVDEICQHLSTGNTRRTSCILAGISEDTFAIWLAKYPDFSDSVKRAEELSIARNVAHIHKAAMTTWQAAAYILERRRPDDWRLKTSLDITTNGKDIRSMSTDELEATLERLRTIVQADRD